MNYEGPRVEAGRPDRKIIWVLGRDDRGLM